MASTGTEKRAVGAAADRGGVAGAIDTFCIRSVISTGLGAAAEAVASGAEIIGTIAIARVDLVGGDKPMSSVSCDSWKTDHECFCRDSEAPLLMLLVRSALRLLPYVEELMKACGTEEKEVS